MGSTTIQAQFGEEKYSIGRLVLDRARALGISRTELVRRLGYRDVGNGHKALSELLTTGKILPLIARHLAEALQVDEELVASIMAATARQQQDEASKRILARETAYRTAFQPHLRCETELAIPEPLFVAALLHRADAAFQHIADSQLAGNLLRVDRLVSVSERCIARNHKHRRKPR